MVNNFRVNTVFKWYPGKYQLTTLKSHRVRERSKAFIKKASMLFIDGYEVGYILQNLVNHFHFLSSRLPKVKHQCLDLYLRNWIMSNDQRTLKRSGHLKIKDLLKVSHTYLELVNFLLDKNTEVYSGSELQLQT